MFRIIRDEQQAQLFNDAGLLWWVSKEDGADTTAMFTAPMRRFSNAPLYWVRRGVVGIKLEE